VTRISRMPRSRPRLFVRLDHTGDLGSLDDQGLSDIRGRKKI